MVDSMDEQSSFNSQCFNFTRLFFRVGVYVHRYSDILSQQINVYFKNCYRYILVIPLKWKTQVNQTDIYNEVIMMIVL